MLNCSCGEIQVLTNICLYIKVDYLLSSKEPINVSVILIYAEIIHKTPFWNT